MGQAHTFCRNLGAVSLYGMNDIVHYDHWRITVRALYPGEFPAHAAVCIARNPSQDNFLV